MRPIAKRFVLRLAAPAQGRLLAAEGPAARARDNREVTVEQKWAVGGPLNTQLPAFARRTVAALAHRAVVLKASLFVRVVAEGFVLGLPAPTERGAELSTCLVLERPVDV